jgi:KDO2-lipid IV(A) lauroyltransferase
VKAILDLLGYFGLRAASSLICRMPERMAEKTGTVLGACAFSLHSRRRVAYADIKAALGPQFSEKARMQIIRDQYRHFGQMFVEVLRIPRISRSDIEKNVEISNFEYFRQTVDGQCGAILITGHFGNWELLQIISGIFDKPVYALNRPQKLTRMNEYLNRLRKTQGSVTIGRGMGVRDLLRALKRKELVGILGDQDAGKTGGVILPFLGRKTTIPTGAFELAYRTGVPVLPAFMARTNGFRHRIYLAPPIRMKEQNDDEASEVERATHVYLELLEKYIRKFPDQWLWGTKRWKYTWTKRILILSDGKPGHVKQSEAVAARFRHIKTQYGRPGMEYPISKIEVRFKSEWRKKLFPWFALFFIPWAQGRLRFLSYFFTSDTQQAIEQASAEFIISAGSSLAPLGLCLSKDSRAKNIVVMKPSFPFNLFQYDLAIVPAHDRGPIPSKSLRMLLTPTLIETDAMKCSGEALKRKLRQPERVKFGILLGGTTRNFSLDLCKTRKFFQVLSGLSCDVGDYMVTTSRRTPDDIVKYLKENVRPDLHCQLMVIANESNPPETVPGIMALADILIVTEDSISMISEAVSSGKKVVVLDLGSGLPAKHRRFIDLLAMKSAVVRANPDNFCDQLAKLDDRIDLETAKRETQMLQTKLQEIL